MSYQAFEQYSRILVREQPSTPRRYTLAILRHIVFHPIAITGFFFGCAALWASITLFVPPQINLVRFVFFGIIPIIFGIIMVCGPLIGAWNYHYALRHGHLAVARVTELDLQGAGASFETFQGATYGSARGQWVVRGPRETFTVPFRIERPWATQLRVGSSVPVLVHPTKPRVLLELGWDM